MTDDRTMELAIRLYPGRSICLSRETWFQSHIPTGTETEYVISVLPGAGVDACTQGRGKTAQDAMLQIVGKIPPQPEAIGELRAELLRPVAELDSITKGGENVS